MPEKMKSSSARRASTPTVRRRRIKDADPTLHYRWTSPTKVEQRQEDDNYQIICRPGTTTPITSGGDILMACPLNEYRQREEERREDAAADLKGPAEGFKMQGLKSGVDTIDLSKESRGPMSDVLGRQPDPKIGKDEKN